MCISNGSRPMSSPARDSAAARAAGTKGSTEAATLDDTPGTWLIPDCNWWARAAALIIIVTVLFHAPRISALVVEVFA